MKKIEFAPQKENENENKENRFGYSPPPYMAVTGYKLDRRIRVLEFKVYEFSHSRVSVERESAAKGNAAGEFPARWSEKESRSEKRARFEERKIRVW